MVDVAKAVAGHEGGHHLLDDPDVSEDTKLRFVTKAVVGAQAEPA